MLRRILLLTCPLLVSLLAVACDSSSSGGGTGFSWLKVEKVERKVDGKHVLVTLHLECENTSTQPLTLRPPHVKLFAEGKEIPEFVRPFAETITVAPGQSGKAAVPFWLEEADAGKKLEVHCGEAIVPVTLP